MNRLFIKAPDQAQKTVEGLYKDIERRIIASPPGQCPVELTASFLRVCHSQSCGKCAPCRIGLGQLQIIMDKILDMNIDATLDDLKLLERTAQAIKVSADCAIGTEGAELVLRGIKGFREDFVSHIEKGHCMDSIRKQLEPVPCVAKCPANVDVPGYIALVKNQRYADAVRVIRKDNPFPTVCALICEHHCELRCRRTMIDAPINIRGLKRYAVDHSGPVPVPEKLPATGKKIAIIGGGPSGLTAAYYLSLMGHQVTIFEKQTQLGGMLRYGIPNYRLPRERLQEDIDAIVSTGVEVKTGFDVSSREEMEKIKSVFDAMYICIGSHNAKAIGIEGEFAKGVIPAVEMLRGIGDEDMPDFYGKMVCVIGGGNVAMDVARTAKRLGAREVNIVYRRRREDMTALPIEVDGAVAEGCNLRQLCAPSKIETDEDGYVKALWVKPQMVGVTDRSGRPSPTNASAPEERMECDIIISAIGQATDSSFFDEYGIPTNRGNIKAAKNSVVDSENGKIYAGGDCVTGPSTVINAIAAGKVAAANIDAFLGYEHTISVDVEIPNPTPNDHTPCGRVEMNERIATHRGSDFDEVENGMSLEEALQEAGRCLRCDFHGFGGFRGGRNEEW